VQFFKNQQNDIQKTIFCSFIEFEIIRPFMLKK